MKSKVVLLKVLHMTQRNGKTLFAIDIAVPRDIEAECRNLENVVLHDVDDLKNVVNGSFAHRRLEAEKAEKIISNNVEEFMDLLREMTVIPHIRKLKERARQQCSDELEEFFSNNPELSPELRLACQEYGRQMAAKWLHKQIMTFKELYLLLRLGLPFSKLL